MPEIRPRPVSEGNSHSFENARMSSQSCNGRCEIQDSSSPASSLHERKAVISRATVMANQKHVRVWWNDRPEKREHARERPGNPSPVDWSAAVARDVQEGPGPEIVPESVKVVALRIALNVD